MHTEYPKAGPAGARKNIAPGDNDEHFIPGRFERFEEAGSLDPFNRMMGDYKKGRPGPFGKVA